MSQPAVERAHGKMITDPFFRDRFFEDPAGTSASAGLDLSQEELRALVRLPPAAASRLSLFLDNRIAGFPIGAQPAAEVVSG